MFKGERERERAFKKPKREPSEDLRQVAKEQKVFIGFSCRVTKRAS